MNAITTNHPAVPSENWDDDFEFQRNTDRDIRKEKTDINSSNPSQIRQPRPALEDWAEPGPSTPSKRRPSQTSPRRQKQSPAAENWDDDFEDSPIRNSTSSRRRAPRSSSHLLYEEPEGGLENWDDDFEVQDNPPHVLPTGQSRNHADADDSDDDEIGEFGLQDIEEDRTVTARSRRAALVRHTSSAQDSPPPPVPALPASLTGFNLGPGAEPFPRSPTISVFSVPVSTGWESINCSSTSHLALRPTISGSSASALAALPPSPPIHKDRERRRLRKKSRPPYLDHNLLESQDEDSPPSRSHGNISTPESAGPTPLPSSAEPASPGPSHKTPLLQRIGSVKKWGVRKKRASTSPNEIFDLDSEPPESISNDNTPRPSTTKIFPPSDDQPENWFFRRPLGSGSPHSTNKAELKHEKSIDRFRVLNPSLRVGHPDQIAPDSPTKPGKHKRLPFMGKNSDLPQANFTQKEDGESLLLGPRRPTSMQVPKATQYPRYASYGGTSLSRSTAKVLVSASTEDLSNDHAPQEGSRSFLGSVRKISLVGTQKRHKRTKSHVGEAPSLPSLSTTPEPPLSQNDDIQAPVDRVLLPPIELQPPSPPRVVNGMVTSHSAPITISAGINSLLHPTETSSGSYPPHGSRSPTKSPGSPQSASLGRSAQAPNSAAAASSEKVPRRNSLGDLKIPARISQAQIGLKRDLGMVREFAASVEQLKDLQATYHSLILEVQSILDTAPPLSISRATSPTFFHLPRPVSRARSNTNPVPPPAPSAHKHLATSFYSITSRYQTSWECAELLIELGGGTPATAPAASASAPGHIGSSGSGSVESRKSRERAITLAGDESKPPAPPLSGPPLASPPHLAWRASTGRHDLSQRQLVLLRDMLHTGVGRAGEDLLIPEEGAVNRQWRWGDSTVTLPSEESTQGTTAESPTKKKRRSSRMGMSGLRDLLRSLKRGQGAGVPVPSMSSASASASASTDSSLNSHAHQHTTTRRRAKTSTGPESIRSSQNGHQIGHEPLPPTSPYNTSSLHHKSSPRRPSLAAIFRLGQRSRSAAASADTPSMVGVGGRRRSGQESSTTEEEDWDRIESASDLDLAAKALGIDGSATVKGRKGRSPYLLEQQQQRRPATPKRTPNASQTSLWCDTAPPGSPHSLHQRTTRLSNVEEAVDEARGSTRAPSKGKQRAVVVRASPSRRGGSKTGSVRSAPPQALGGVEQKFQLEGGKLAMTPENIKPLLENAREVRTRLHECIGEVRRLLAVVP